MKSGLAQPQLPTKNLIAIEFSSPLFEIQKQIVEKIEDEGKIIEANEKLIDLFQQKIEAKIKSIHG